LINGQVRLLDFQIEKIGSSTQMKGAGFGQSPHALFTKIRHVFTGECLEVECVLHGPGHRLLAVDFAECDNLLHVMAGVHAAIFKFPVVVLGLGAKGDKAHMVRIFKVFMSVIGPWVTGDQFFTVIDADPVRICFEGQVCPGIFGWN